MENILLIIIIGLGCGAFGFVLHLMYAKRYINSAENRSKEIIDNAHREADRVVKEGKLEVKNELIKLKAEFEESTKERRKEVLKQEQWLEQKKSNLDRRIDLLEKKEEEINVERGKINKIKDQIETEHERVRRIIREEEAALQRIAGLSREEAYKRLLEKLEAEVEYDSANLIRRKQQEAQEQSEEIAKNIISQAIQRCASDHVAETTVCSVSLPSDDIKGRIIGREGRNIRTLENGTGVEVLIDDTPNAVVISGFDPVRREIARRALEKLIADGRIHPARIEEILKKVEKDLEIEMVKTGTKAAHDLGISGLDKELLKLIGRLKFRTSYGQNLLNHSVEVAKIMAIMAEEMHEDPINGRLVGLLHDIGKAVDTEVDGPHAEIGAEIAKRYKMPDNIINAIAAHHNEVEPKTVLAVMASAADAISAARPGARAESYDLYLKRIEQLEDIATGIDGVQSAYAIQAGREIRVIVDGDKIDDSKTIVAARNIAKKISDEVKFPGQIKVTVVRETRVVEYAT